MTTELKQPEALRLADWLQACAESIEQINAANELRRLHALTQRPAAQEVERDPTKIEQAMRQAYGEFDSFLTGGCKGEPPRMSIAFASGLFKTIVREQGLFFTAPRQATPASAPQSLLMRLAGIAAECSDPDTTDALDALIAATQQATPEPAQADSSEHLRVIASLGAALRRLSFAAQTSGGTVGPDAELQAAIGQAEQALSFGGIAQAMFPATPEPVGEVVANEFFAWDAEGGIAFYKTQQEAIDHAKESLNYYLDGANANGEWDEDVEQIRWGVVMQRAQATNVSATEDGESSCEYELQDLATRPAPGVPEDVADLLCSVADNLNDMPISDEYAAKTAKKAYDLLVKHMVIDTPSAMLAAAQAKGGEQ